METPYIFVSDYVPTSRPIDYDAQRGMIYEEIGGHHAIWAARIPFLPSFLSEDFVRRTSQERIDLIARRQYRFIYDLSRAQDGLATFDLRFIAHPSRVVGQPNPIDVALLGKVFTPRRDRRVAEVLALRLWEKLYTNFPLEDPFNYPIEPVTESDDFAACYQPIRIDTLRLSSIAEIRKHEDLPIQNEGRLAPQARIGDYIAYPYVPTLTFAPMIRFIEALAVQPQTCFVSISLRPVTLFPQEVQSISYMVGRFRQTADQNEHAAREYLGMRAEIGLKVYHDLMLEREHLSMVRVHIVGEESSPYGVAEALGSEMMDNGSNDYPTQWDIAQPTSELELQKAMHNLTHLEHDHWGETVAAVPLQRLRYLATAKEASGAFRLPVPPESGYVPGILVRNEPFVAPADYLEVASGDQFSDPSISLGQIYHRGKATPQQFSVRVEDLTRHTLIAGSTGAGKTSTIRCLLERLWTEYQLPFMVLYPVDKPDYRQLLTTPGLEDDLLIFTLGDETTSPFRFNPFEVPEGMLLKTHLSRLMRVFTAAFTLFDPLPMVYRDALRRVYQSHGWNPVLDRSVPERSYPIMSEFFSAIDKVTSELHYGRELQDNVRQASVIRIGDLLDNAGYVVNVRRSMPFSLILDSPVVMEIGRVGSAEDTALLMGFLLMRLAGELERAPRSVDHPHITVVEEAHRLMPERSTTRPDLIADPRSSAGEDFSNILAEVRGYGEGIIIAEQIPTLLVKGAIGNTYIKIMHWLEDVPSFDLFGDIMNLSEAQRVHARTLKPGHAIVRSPYGRPVHIKVPEAKAGNITDTSDAAVEEHMIRQRSRLGLDASSVEPWTVRLSAAPRRTDQTNNVAARILSAPMKTCSYCHPLLTEGKCPYRKRVDELLAKPEDGARRKAIADILFLSEPSERWSMLAAIAESIGESNGRGQVYCYFAHLTEGILQRSAGDSSAEELRRRFRNLLNEFDTYYPAE